MFRTFALAASALALAAALAACSGDDAGNDEDFARGLCEASTELRAGIREALGGATTSTSPNAGAEALVEPLETFVGAFKDLSAPEDLQDWHDDATDQLESVLKDFKEHKQLSTLTGFADSPVPDPPAAAKSRIRTAAQDVPECNGVTFFRPD